MEVRISYPATGEAELWIDLPYPGHDQSVECGTNQERTRTPSGTLVVQAHGGAFFRRTRRWEGLSEEDVAAVFEFLEAIDFAAGEVRYDYFDLAAQVTKSAYCFIVDPTSESKISTNNRDVTLVFEQYSHPDRDTDATGESLGSYGGGAIGSGEDEEPHITSALLATGTEDVAFSYTITASGIATITFGATGLPSFLSRTGAVISGTPATADIGEYEVTITATNGEGVDSKTLVIRIGTNNDEPSDPPFAPELWPGFEFDVYEEFDVEIQSVATGTAPLAFSSPDLPAWLSIDPDTGLITGTVPDEPVSPTVTFTVEVTNDEGSDDHEYELTILESTPPTITSPDTVTFTPGITSGHTLTATGSTPIVWTVDSGDLPAWMVFTASTGRLAGPAPDEITTIVIDPVTATNGAGFDTQALTIRVGVEAAILTIDDFTTSVATEATLVINFTYEGTDATVSLSGAPAWAVLAFEDGVGTVTMNPLDADLDDDPYEFDLIVSNDHLTGGVEDTRHFEIEVTPVPAAITSIEGGLGWVVGAGLGPFLFGFTYQGTEPVILSLSDGPDPVPAWATLTGEFGIGLPSDGAGCVRLDPQIGDETSPNIQFFFNLSNVAIGGAVENNLLVVAVT